MASSGKPQISVPEINEILRSLIADLLLQAWFSLLAGLTKAISNRQQVIITLLWVSENYDVNEAFFGLFK